MVCLIYVAHPHRAMQLRLMLRRQAAKDNWNRPLSEGLDLVNQQGTRIRRHEILSEGIAGLF